MPQPKLTLFGPPGLELDNRSVEISLRKALALLAYLAFTRQPHSRDVLATLLWPENNQKSARANLRRMVYELHRRTKIELLEATTDTVAINPSLDLWLDVHAFENHARAGLSQEQNVAALLLAADIYADDFMAGFILSDSPEFDDWQFFQREELRQLLAQVLQALLNHFEESDEHGSALPYARRWLALDPLHELAHRRLMTLYALDGQQAAAIRQYDECVRILEEELEAPPEEETQALFEAIRTRRFPKESITEPSSPSRRIAIQDKLTSASDHSSAQPPVRNMPAPTTPFVGRKQEIDEIVRRMGDPACRLLTLNGPGGIGKTRLAVEVAHHIAVDTTPQARMCTDGVAFVALQPIELANDVPTAIAGSMGFRFQGDAPAWQQLLSHLAQLQILLVLDNFEHLLDGTYMVADILAHCPEVKMLVTSRETLNLREEWFHPIAGLRYGTALLDTDSTEATGGAVADAGQLFVQRARRVDPGFSLEGHEKDVHRVCQMVDGIPLAIELAAAWLKVLDIGEVINELKQGMDILSGQERNLPERHRSMQVVLEQSWQMLDSKEQYSLMGLSVFRGGFDRRAAAVVADASYPILANLVGKSFLHFVDKRYQIHELLRQFCSQKLHSELNRERSVEEQHSDFYLNLLAEQMPIINSPDQRLAFANVAKEFDNIRAAWEYGVTHGSREALAKSLRALDEIYTISSRHEEASRVFTNTIAELSSWRSDGEIGTFQRLRGTLLIIQAGFDVYFGRHTKARELLTQAESIPLLPEDVARAKEQAGEVCRALADNAGAAENFLEGIAISRKNNDQLGLARCLIRLSSLHSGIGQFEDGRSYLSEALERADVLGRPDVRAFAMSAMAWSSNCLGYYQESEAYWHEILAIHRANDDQFGIANALNFLGWETWSQGGEKLKQSRSYHEEALSLLRKLGNRNYYVMALADAGLTMNELSEFDKTVELCAEGIALSKDAEMTTFIGYNMTVLGVAQAELGHISEGIVQVYKAVHIQHGTDQLPQCLLSLHYLMYLLAKHPTERERVGLSERRLYDNVLFLANHPAIYHPIADRAKRLQQKLSETLELGSGDLADASITVESIVESIPTDWYDMESKRLEQRLR